MARLRAGTSQRDTVVEFWRAVELFSPQNIEKASPADNVYRAEKKTDLPWHPDHPHQKKETYNDKWVWTYTVYCGIYHTSKVIDEISPADELEAEQRRNFRGAETAVFGLDVDRVGSPQGFVLSSCAWGLSKLLLNREQDLRELDGFRATEKLIKEKFLDEPFELSEIESLDYKFLKNTTAKVADFLGISDWVPDMEIRIKAVQVRLKDIDDGAGFDFLNSFYIDDLQEVASRVAGGNFGSGLHQYLGESSEGSGRVDVRKDRRLFFESLAPINFPKGRWPSKGHYPLVASQQFAVNQITAKFAGGGTGLFPVNGPPGTGKTTLLRDLVAHVVVERAEQLAKLKHPSQAMDGEHHWRYDGYSYSLPIWAPEFTGHEIVVASNNNGAVENVSLEIPALDSIDPEWHDQAEHFRSIASFLIERPAWGLAAARLGRMKNRSQFASKFYWDKERGLLPILERMSEEDPPDWKESVEYFEEAVADEQRIRLDLQRRYESCLALYDRVDGMVAEELALKDLERDHVEAKKRVKKAAGLHDEAEAKTSSIATDKTDLDLAIANLDVEAKRLRQSHVDTENRLGIEAPAISRIMAELARVQVRIDATSRAMHDLSSEIEPLAKSMKAQEKQRSCIEAELELLNHRHGRDEKQGLSSQEELDTLELEHRSVCSEEPSFLLSVITFGVLKRRWRAKVGLLLPQLQAAKKEVRATDARVSRCMEQILDAKLRDQQIEIILDEMSAEYAAKARQMSELDQQLETDKYQRDTALPAALEEQDDEEKKRWNRILESLEAIEEELQAIPDRKIGRQDKLRLVMQQLDDSKARSDLLRSRLETQKKKCGALGDKIRRGRKSLSKEKKAISKENDRLIRKNEDIGSCFPDPFSWSDEEKYEWQQKLSPWASEEWNAARALVFLRGLKLHRDFIASMPQQLIRYVRSLTYLLKGQGLLLAPPGAIASLWQTLTFFVPVISTTFASFARMFQGMDRESLGWLFIDEAGQATLPSATGAIWRSKRTVVLGDPLQLRPIVTIPMLAEEKLRKTFNVDEKWLPTSFSVQELSDRTADVGTAIKEEVWVGAPLCVHRRCDNPMFRISNEIAYEGLMVLDLPTRKDCELPPSSWIHVRTKSKSPTHWIYSEEEVLYELLDFLKSRTDPKHIFLLSPFRTCARKLEEIGPRYGIPYKQAGTVHTAQGKEADIVILVLGGSSDGAREWASSRPNLLNVAVSRAKRRLYVIGNWNAWSERRHFSECAHRLGKVSLKKLCRK